MKKLHVKILKKRDTKIQSPSQMGMYRGKNYPPSPPALDKIEYMSGELCISQFKSSTAMDNSDHNLYCNLCLNFVSVQMRQKPIRIQ